MKTTKILSILCGLFLIVSCNNFLDVPPSNQADATTAINNDKDAQVFMNGILRKMASSNYYGRNFILYGDAKGGDLAITSQGRGYDGLYSFNHAPNSGSYEGYWSQMYHCIAQVNTLITAIDKITTPTNKMKEIYAEALTLRGLIYFDLVRLYGKPYNMDKNSLGVPVTLTPLNAADQLTRVSVDAVYTQILADLKAAETGLAKVVKKGYINYFGNKAIQAKVYLYMEKYSDALAAAKEVMGSPLYSLYKNSDWVDSWKSQWGKESLFELGVFPEEADLGSGSLGFYYRRYRHGSTSAMGWFLASDYFIARLKQDPTDIRWGIMDKDEIGDDQNIDRKGSCYKYSGSITLAGDGKATATAVNIKVIRLSEVYLIAAEAAMASDKAEAAGYLNKIRQRSPGLAPASAANITIDMILDERSKEFFGEGHRFFDMMRLNKTVTYNDELIVPAVVITHRTKTVNRNFYKSILPISKTEIDANPNIASQQNPGY